MTKQSEAAKTYFIGHDPDKEQKWHPAMGRPLSNKMILLDMRG